MATLALANAAAAQQEHSLDIEQVAVLDEGSKVAALVSVLDAAGKPVEGLEAFEIEIDGEPAVVESVERVINRQSGISIVLVMDVSGSMAGPPLAQSREAAVTLVERLLPQDTGALTAFAGTVRAEVEFTADSAALAEQIRALQPEENTGTALYDAIVEGIHAAGEAPTQRRAVVLLTDGRDTGDVSVASQREALDAATAGELPIYAVSLGADADIALLQELADSSGGHHYQAPTADNIPAIFDAIGEALRGQYIVTALLPELEPGDHDLATSVAVDGDVLINRSRFDIADTKASGGVPLAALLTAVVVVVAVLTVLGFRMGFRPRWRRRPRRAGGPGSDPTLPQRPATHAESVAASGRLAVVGGPNAGVTMDVGRGPVDLGAGPACGLRLDAAGQQVAPLHARVWMHGKRLMIHHLAGGRHTIVADEPVSWAVLESGDTLQIGPHVLAFSERAEPRRIET